MAVSSPDGSAVVGKPAGGTRDIQSLHRAFDILEAIGRGNSLGVTEIARRTSLPVSTVHNLLRTMSKRHYVLGSQGRYSLGPAVTVLTSEWDPVQSLSQLIKRHLGPVIEVTGQTGFGTMLVGNRARVIAYRAGAGPISVNELHEDGAEPLAIATGRLLVAMSREAEWGHFIDATTDVDPAWSTQQWRDDLRAIAATGLCVRHLPSVAESTAVVVAVPVWGPGSAVICSIGVGAPRLAVTPELAGRIVDALWDASIALSAELGCDVVPLPRPDPGLPVLRSLGLGRTD